MRDHPDKILKVSIPNSLYDQIEHFAHDAGLSKRDLSIIIFKSFFGDDEAGKILGLYLEMNK